MTFNFLVTQYRKSHSGTPKNTIVLAADNWDDYSYKTTFSATYFSARGESTHLGNLKVGCTGQPKGWTSELIPNTFANLAENWFSLGQDVDYYKNLIECFGQSEQLEVLKALRDVAADSLAFERAENEEVFASSILRSVSISAITGQFRRVISGNAPLTEFQDRKSVV